MIATPVIVRAPVGIRMAIESAAGSHGFEPINGGDNQTFCSLLYRTPEAIGVMWCYAADEAGRELRAFRQADMRNPLLALLRAPDCDPYVMSAAAALQRATALAAGADDAQPWPMDSRELGARLKALGSRGRYFDHQEVRLPNGAVFRDSLGGIEVPGRPIVWLSPTQIAMLRGLAVRTGEVVSKEKLMDLLYDGRDDEPGIKIVDVLICKLRQRLALATGGVDVIATIWGRGYQFRPEGFEPSYNRVRASR